MEWINVNDQMPEKYHEILGCSNEGRVKTAIYMGNAWSTYVPVVYWMPLPDPPDGLFETPIEVLKKKRGRPKKNA